MSKKRKRKKYANREIILRRASETPPIVSVVVPVFNAAAYLRDCIASLLAQTLEDVEFIFVDDGSEDDSRKIIEEYARKDSRVINIRLAQNSGAFIARKTGVAAARASCVTFLDPDDKLLPDACRLFANAMQDGSVDIVHGGMDILNKNNLPRERIEVVEKMVCPKIDHLEGRAIIQALAIDGKINPGLCGKAYKTSLIRRANDVIPEGRYRRAQDFLVNFVVCCMAERYVSFQDGVYQYGYGQGFFGAAKRDISYYRTLCTQVDILSPLRSAVEQEFPDDATIAVALETTEDRLIGGSWSQIFSLLHSSADRKEAFSLLLDKAGGLRLAEVLAKRNYANKEDLALMLDSLEAVPKATARTIRKIGIFYYHLTPGGVQRVITTLIPIYKKLGCSVVLFLEKQIDDSCFSIDPEVQIEYLPVVSVINRNEITRRLRILAEAIERHGIDMFYHHAFLSPNLLWDLLVCKWASRIPVFIHYHTATSYRPRVANESYSRWPGFGKVFSFADGVLVLSRADEVSLRLCGANAKYIPNPVPFEDIVGKRRVPLERNEIVWIARFSREKHPSDSVKILSMVRECIPDAKLTIVGSGPEIFIKEIMATIDKFGLSEAVAMVGEQKDVRQYYERASVYLHTSNLEGFPVSLLEAGAFGLPIVMYTLPWLEIARDNEGVLQVPQSDLKAAASSIVSVLSSPERAAIMSTANQERVRKFYLHDFEEEWHIIFECMKRGVQFGGNEGFDKADVLALHDQIMHCYARGIMEEQNVWHGCEKERLRLSGIVEQLKALRDKLKAELAESQTRRREIWAQRDKMKESMLRACSERDSMKAEVAGLRAELAKSMKRRGEIWAQRDRMRESMQKAIAKQNAAQEEVVALKLSESYRVGMLVTWPARMVWNAIKHLKKRKRKER